MLDYGETEDVVYLVRDYVQAESLADWLNRQQDPLSLPRIAGLMKPLLDAFSYAHRLGFVHYDINLENLLITRDEQIFVDNFGLLELETACAEDRETIVGISSVLYCSPEQANLDPAIDHRSDLYVLGIVLYRLLTGQDLFLGRAPMAILVQHVTEAPISPRFFRPNLPEEAEQVLLKLLQKAPEERYQSAEELAEAIATHFHIPEQEIASLNSTTGERPLAGLPMNLYHRVRRALYEGTYGELRTVFDDRRISVWREPLFEQFNDGIPWVDTAIDFLARQSGSEPYQNGLSLLLQVLSDNGAVVHGEDFSSLAAEVVASQKAR
jgi:serine/threonine protein kinase